MFSKPNQSESIPDSRFEGFFLQMVMPGKMDKCQQIVAKVLDKNWQVKQIGDNYTEFEVTFQDDALSVKEAWNKSYELKMQPEVIDAEPLFAIPLKEYDINSDLQPQTQDIASSEKEESDNVNWCLEQMRVFEAWKEYFPDPNKLPGEGIVIAHPDTGYTLHPEIVDGLIPEKGYDFVKNDKDATDPLQRSGGEIVNNPGHGTSTASVIISSPGKEADYPNDKFITGVAPGAKLVPLRVSYSVALLSVRKLAESIEYAADHNFHAIAISLGAALYNQRLRTAIIYAQKRGVIIVAASGTFFPYVVYPAAYDEVIAVCGSNIKREIWWGASRGKKVDVTAPGHQVWYAKTDKKDDTLEYRIEQGSGTSFSAPFVTGLAALWLSYHGRDKLVERYGAEKIPFIFNQILRDTCDKFPTWEPNKFGAGIVNAQKLLAAPLPDNISRSIIAPALALQQHTPEENGELETFMHLFEANIADNLSSSFNSDLCKRSLSQHLGELLQTGDEDLNRKLKEVGKELAFYFASSPQIYQQLTKSLVEQQSSASPQFQLRAGQLSGEQKSQSSSSTESVRDMLVDRGVSDILNGNISR